MKKAKIVMQMIHEGVLAWSHGLGEIVERLVIEELDNLVITPYRDQVYASTGFSFERCEIIGEVEVPDDLI